MKNQIKMTALALAVLAGFAITSPSFAGTNSSMMMNHDMMKGMMMHGKKMNMDGMMAQMDTIMKMCMKMMQADRHHKKA